MFSESDVLEACAELDSAEVSGWNFFVESHGVKVYQQYNEVTGLYAYKACGTMKGLDAEVFAKTFTDLNYRKQWDTYVNEVKEITDEKGENVIYWQVNYPFPLSNRDYVCKRVVRDLDYKGRRVWVILCKLDESPKFPPVSGVVRVTEYDGRVAIRSDGQGGTEIFMKIYDNPAGLIPTWLINWVAQKGIPAFLVQVEKACEGYPEYLRSSTS